MLQNIRDNSQGIVAKVIVGLIICTFALFGIESIVSLGGGEDAPATVNGEEITEYEVAQMIDLQKRRFQAQFGENFDPSFLNDNMLRKSAVESLVEEKVLAQAAEEVGVYYSDAAIDSLILQSPEFQEAGQFSADRFDLILRNAGFTRASYREMLRNNLSLAQGRAAWLMTSVATSAEALVQNKLEAQTRDFAYIEFKLADAKKGVVVSDEEISEYYEANQGRFMSDEMVSVKYVELSQAKMAENVFVDEEEIQARYEDMKIESENKKEYRVAHVLILGADEVAKKKAIEAKAKLDDGASFEEVVKTYSEDDSSKFAGGDLGFADLSVYEPEFAEAVSSLSVNEVSEAVETRDGLHLIKVLETRQPEVASLAELTDTIASELKADKASSLYVEKLEQLKDEAFSADSLEPVAASLDLKLQKTDFFGRSGGPGIASDRKFSNAAFEESVLFDGSNSEVIELADGHAVVLHLNEFKESKVKSLELVQGQIKTLITNDKAAEKLVELSTKSLEDVRSGVQLSYEWSVYRDATRADKEVNSEALAKAFAMATVEGGSSYSLVESRGNKVLVRLDAINDVDEIEIAKEVETGLLRQTSNNEFKAFKQYQIDVADIERS